MDEEEIEKKNHEVVEVTVNEISEGREITICRHCRKKFLNRERAEKQTCDEHPANQLPTMGDFGNWLNSR